MTDIKLPETALELVQLADEVLYLNAPSHAYKEATALELCALAIEIAKGERDELGAEKAQNYAQVLLTGSGRHPGVWTWKTDGILSKDSNGENGEMTVSFLDGSDKAYVLFEENKVIGISSFGMESLKNKLNSLRLDPKLPGMILRATLPFPRQR